MNKATIYLKDIKLFDVSDLSLNDYWTNLPFYKKLSAGYKMNFESPVTFIVGENGSGKSTLIEAIAVALGFNAEGGSKNFNFSTFDTTSNLHEYLITSKISHEKDGFFLRAESFYNVASNIEQLNINVNCYGGKSLHSQSHGESFLSLIQNRFRGNGLYILDEPEAALSPMRQLTLLIEMERLIRDGSQFIIATHSPIILSFPNACIYNIDLGIETIEYENTEHYTLTKTFLNNHKEFIKKLLL